MQFGFMSSVCPSLTLAELIDKARRYDYQHLELRVEWGHGHGVELDATQEQLREAKLRFADSGIVLSCIATGCRFVSVDAQERAAQVELLKRYIGLAETVGAQNVRIFGDPVPKTPVEVAQTLGWEAEGIRACDALAGEAGVALCLETHGNLIASYVSEVLHRAEAKHTFVNWHAAHHVRHGEPVEVAYAHLRGKIRHAHVNFGIAGPLPSTERESLRLLADDAYAGFVSVEVINPPDSDAVLQRHADFWERMQLSPSNLKFPYTIHKFELERGAYVLSEFESHEIMEVLHVGLQKETSFLWALVNLNSPKKEYHVISYHTGAQMNQTTPDYLGTLIQENGVVWHFFWHRTASSEVINP